MEAIFYPYKVAEKCHLLAYVLIILTLIPIISTVRMIGIQKEKLVALNLSVTHTFDLHPYKEKLFQVFLLVPTLVDINVGTLGGTKSK
jgi:hypothetical protein